MKRTLLLATLMVFAGLASHSVLASTPQVSQHSTQAGTRFTLVHMPNARRITINMAWSSNWARRTDVNQAVPYIGAELLLAGGAEGYSAGEVGELFADMQSEGHLMPAVDHLFATFQFAPEHAQSTLAIANAHLAQPALATYRFDSIRRDFGSHINALQQLPADKGFASVRWAVYGDSPLREALSLDVPAMIERVTVDDVARWRRATLGRNNAQIVIAGQLDAAAASDMVEQLLRGLPQLDSPEPPAISGNFKARRILLHLPDAQSTVLAFIGRLPPTRKGGEFDDIILLRQLGGGDNSVLNEATKGQFDDTHTFGAGIDAFTRQDRILVLSGKVDAGNLAAAETVVRKAYQSFLDDLPISSLDALKKPMFDNIAHASKEPSAMAQSALFALLDERKPDIALELDRQVDAISESTLAKRLNEAFPAVNEFVVIAVSAQANALPGACVITTPAQAADC